MVSRICGILGGVLISLFLSVLIFPTSASQKATTGLSEGLQALTTLSRMAWGKEGKESKDCAATARSASHDLASPPLPLYIGLGQREAQVNHELLFNHA